MTGPGWLFVCTHGAGSEEAAGAGQLVICSLVCLAIWFSIAKPVYGQGQADDEVLGEVLCEVLGKVLGDVLGEVGGASSSSYEGSCSCSCSSAV